MNPVASLPQTLRGQNGGQGIGFLTKTMEGTEILETVLKNPSMKRERTIACAANHEEQFRKAMDAKQKAEAKKELAAKRRQLTLEKRHSPQATPFPENISNTVL